MSYIVLRYRQQHRFGPYAERVECHRTEIGPRQTFLEYLGRSPGGFMLAAFHRYRGRLEKRFPKEQYEKAFQMIANADPDKLDEYVIRAFGKFMREGGELEDFLGEGDFGKMHQVLGAAVVEMGLAEERVNWVSVAALYGAEPEQLKRSVIGEKVLPLLKDEGDVYGLIMAGFSRSEGYSTEAEYRGLVESVAKSERAVEELSRLGTDYGKRFAQLEYVPAVAKSRELLKGEMVLFCGSDPALQKLAGATDKVGLPYMTFSTDPDVGAFGRAGEVVVSVRLGSAKSAYPMLTTGFGYPDEVQLGGDFVVESVTRSPDGVTYVALAEADAKKPKKAQVRRRYKVEKGIKEKVAKAVKKVREGALED